MRNVLVVLQSLIVLVVPTPTSARIARKATFGIKEPAKYVRMSILMERHA